MAIFNPSGWMCTHALARTQECATLRAPASCWMQPTRTTCHQPLRTATDDRLGNYQKNIRHSARPDPVAMTPPVRQPQLTVVARAEKERAPTGLPERSGVSQEGATLNIWRSGILGEVWFPECKEAATCRRHHPGNHPGEWSLVRPALRYELDADRISALPHQFAGFGSAAS